MPSSQRWTRSPRLSGRLTSGEATQAPLAQWQSNGLLIRRFWVRIPGGARSRKSEAMSLSSGRRARGAIATSMAPRDRPHRSLGQRSPQQQPGPAQVSAVDPFSLPTVWAVGRDRGFYSSGAREPASPDEGRSHAGGDAGGDDGPHLQLTLYLYGVAFFQGRELRLHGTQGHVRHGVRLDLVGLHAH